MTLNYQKPFTNTFNAPVTIEEQDNITRLTVIGVGGTVTMLGSERFQEQASGPIEIPEGIAFTEIAGPYSFLAGITLTPTSSMLLVLMK